MCNWRAGGNSPYKYRLQGRGWFWGFRIRVSTTGGEFFQIEDRNISVCLLSATTEDETRLRQHGGVTDPSQLWPLG